MQSEKSECAKWKEGNIKQTRNKTKLTSHITEIRKMILFIRIYVEVQKESPKRFILNFIVQ